MQIFEDLVKCKDCANNINNKCILYPGKDVKEENAGCYVGIDKIEELENEYEYLAKDNQRVNKLEIQLLQGLLESEE